MFNWTEILVALAAGALTALVTVGPFIWLFRRNAGAYQLFKLDKSCAENAERRIPEWRLLEAAQNWGWMGAKLAQRRFRHKTRKEPFRSNLNRIGRMQGAKAIFLGTVLGSLAIWPQTRIVVDDLGRNLATILKTDGAPIAANLPLRPRARPQSLGQSQPTLGNVIGDTGDSGA